MYKQVVFLSNSEILYNYKSGFRKNHPTDSCLTFLHDKVLKVFNKCLMTGMILIDLQKAFETIDHDILLEKLVGPNHTFQIDHLE